MRSAAVEQRDAKVVVIDSFNGYLNAMPEERHLTTQLHELQMFLGPKGVARDFRGVLTGVLTYDSSCRHSNDPEEL